MDRARFARLFVVLGIVSAVALMMVPAPAGATAVCNPVSDFDNDGYGDLVVGVPGEKVGTRDNAGAVQVIYGAGGGLTTRDQVWTEAPSTVLGQTGSGDRFGAAVAAGNFDGDAYSDLAVGVPGDGVAGAVNVLYGSSTGLRASAGGGALDDQRFTLGGAGVAGDSFGAALAAGNFNNDAYTDLAIGIPGDDAGAGSIRILYGSGTGLGSAANLAQGGTAEDSAEAGDRFGSALASCDLNGDGYEDLAVGARGEDHVTSNSGGVAVLYGSAAGIQTTGTGAPDDDFFTLDEVDGDGGAEAGDSFGWSLAVGDLDGDGIHDLTAGAPYEDIGFDQDTGEVHVLYGAATGVDDGLADQNWQQENIDVGEGNSDGDLFGYALAIGDLDLDGFGALAIGAPGEDLSNTANAGKVQILIGASGGVTTEDEFAIHQALPAIPGIVEAGDNFGRSLAIGDFGGPLVDDGAIPDLAIGGPLEDADHITNSGVVSVFFGTIEVGFPAPQRFAQDTPGLGEDPEAGDNFAAALD